MSIYNSTQWIDDLDYTIKNLPELHDFSGKTVLITGVTGLICSALTDILIRYNEINTVPIKIYAAGRSLQGICSRFCEFAEKDYFHFVEFDAQNSDFDFPITMDYIIHGAGLSSPDRLLFEPVETMLGNLFGTRALLEYSRKHGRPRLLYISSSEVYGRKENDDPFKESQYGYVDLLNVRNAYANGKRAAEALCISYAQEYGADVVIARPGHVYGPTAKPEDKHVCSVWVNSAVNHEPIVLKSEGNQIRSYCYCLDAAAAIIKTLIKGENKRAYNISAADCVISIRQMAETIAEIAGVQVIASSATDEERKQFNPMENAALDGSSLQKIGWKPNFDLRTGFEHTLSILG